jgi:hypothetical protein
MRRSSRTSSGTGSGSSLAAAFDRRVGEGADAVELGFFEELQQLSKSSSVSPGSR